ncbi:MAG TPA: hypothetical protein VMV17_17090 [Streptosporangiaceae bacterium]|nr:hypothetical protein [Streptosporangiaceae bacterium]
MRDDRREHTLSGEAARQLARQVRYLERLPRNRPVHRRRSVNPAAAAAKNDSQWVTFVTSSALTNQASLSDCAVILDWSGNTGGITSITAVNEMGWQADAGVAGYAKWRQADSKWIIMLIPCPTGDS